MNYEAIKIMLKIIELNHEIKHLQSRGKFKAATELMTERMYSYIELKKII